MDYKYIINAEISKETIDILFKIINYNILDKYKEVILSNDTMLKLKNTKIDIFKEDNIINLIGYFLIKENIIQTINKLSFINIQLNELPHWVTKAKNLHSLFLCNNKLGNDESLKYISKLKKIENLNISKNNLNILTIKLKKLYNLKYVSLTYNEITYIKNLPKNIINIDLSYNLLQEVPLCLNKSLNKLNYLNLSNNLLSKIPNTFFDLINLITINFNYNKKLEINDSDILKLLNFKNLVNMYFDNTCIDKSKIKLLLANHPRYNIIFNTFNTNLNTPSDTDSNIEIDSDFQILPTCKGILELWPT